MTLALSGEAGVRVLLAGLLVLLAAWPVWGQPRFGLGAWRGTLEGFVRSSRQVVRPENRGNVEFERFQTTEQLRIQNFGAYVLDPRVWTMSAGGTFGFTQDRFSVDNEETSSDVRLQGFEFNSLFLPGRPFSAALFANQNESVLTRELAGRSDVLLRNWGGRIVANKLKIPTTVGFRQERREEVARTGGTVSRVEDRRNIFTYQGERSWGDSKIAFDYEFVDLFDAIFRDFSFRSHNGSFDYDLDFGPDLNWHWNSHARARSLSGISPLSTWDIDESLRIDHTDRLQSEYNYGFSSASSKTGTNAGHQGSFVLRHQLFESLFTDVGVNGSLQDFPNGEQHVYGGQAETTYTKRILTSGRLTGNLRGNLQFQENRFAGNEVIVSQEAHTADTPSALPILLNNTSVIASSVVVTKVAAGPLPPGCVSPPGPPTPLALGRDFALLISEDVTQILPIPCSGTDPGINAGDKIAVDYRFLSSTSFTLSSFIWHGGVSVGYEWIRLYFTHDETNDDLISGTNRQILNDRRSDTIGGEVTFQNEFVRVRLSTEGKRQESRRQSFRVWRTAQFVGLSPFPRVELALRLNQAFFRFSRPQSQKRKTFFGIANLNFRLNGSLSLDAFASLNKVDDTLVVDEETKKIGMQLSWRFRRLEINPSLNYIDRTLGENRSDEYQAMVHIVRRF